MSSCLSLSGSTACSAWSSSKVSVNSSQYASFPWLDGVSNLTTFDKALSNYVSDTYVTSKYVDLLGCDGLNKSAMNDYYAQYTTSVICSGLIQSSKDDCDLSSAQSEPLCAETCALMATSEQEIMVNKQLCPKTTKDYMKQIRSDFTICSNPADSLTGSCISGSANEPNNCGFSSNTIGLCTYCASTSPNSTDTCCSSSNSTSRCNGVVIPSSTATLQPIVTTTAAAAGGAANHGLSGGQIAGIVVGSVAAAAIIGALLAFLLICTRRRRKTQTDAALNQPNPQRKGATPPMQQPESPTGYNMVPGGRVARMSALREVPSSSPAYSRTSAAMFGGTKYSDSSDSEAMGASPGAMSRRIPPVTGKRHGSLSSSSALAGLDSDSSPLSGTANQYSSPEGVTSGQSEQLSYFRDYYSQDDIQPGDKVAALWAYSPRAGDEFELDRGEMLKVIGIWDDGWATGVRIPERAEDYDIRHREQRDSGVSNGSQRPGPSPAPSGEIKAFPLVCVCLPQHWRKIIDCGVQEEDDEV
ncbi:SH3 domain protein [Penicillium brasilianum]|uniref:SH3 domain protein n=1 Tax=Penicillium brasilianum TaxID=104259 RepID=A0A1S9RIY4_PENBI|nr:SH3 domain protein [Penicillium brasilianum]